MAEGRASETDGAARRAAAEATGLFSAAPDEAFDQITRLVASAIGARWSFLTVVDANRSFWVSAVGADDQRESAVDESFCQYVIADQASFVVSDARRQQRTMQNRAVTSMGVVAWAGYPLLDHSGHIVGTLCTADDRPRDWTPVELQLLETLAAAASRHIQLQAALIAVTASAAALLAELDVRDAMAAHASNLADLSAGLAAATTTAEVSHFITKSGAAALAASFANLAVVDEGGRRVRIEHGSGLPSGMAERYATLPLDDMTPLSHSIANGQPILIQNLSELEARYPHLVTDTIAADLEATASVPLRRADRTIIGALGLGWSAAVEFTPLALANITTVAEMCAQALERSLTGDARYHFLRSLQDALIGDLPNVEGLDIDARYLPANSELGFGGDWYDVIALNENQTAVITGDVCGHGIDAAATMTQIRGAVNAIVRLNSDSIETLFHDVERALARPDRDFVATASVHIIDTLENEITYVAAGHPPALIIDLDRNVNLLEGGRRPVIGLGGKPPIVGRAPFPDGALLVTYTDGLIEQDSRDLDAGIARLAHLAQSCRDNDLNEILNKLADPHSRAGDDIVVTLVRRKADADEGATDSTIRTGPPTSVPADLLRSASTLQTSMRSPTDS